MLECTSSQVNLPVVLRNGQSFRWRPSLICESDFVGVFSHRVWQLHRVSEKAISYKILARFSTSSDHSTDLLTLRNYFQLDKVDLPKLYSEWSEADENFKKLMECQKETLEGICILNQHPLECLFSFICSSNNNIQRISGMVERMCEKFGESVTTEDGETFYDFPKLINLTSSSVVDTLRTLGFGYRANYIGKTAQKLYELGGEKWLETLKNMDYNSAKTQLLQLTGVGPKVADCVLLMSLEKCDVVPIDTHVWQITANNYLPQLKQQKTLNPKLYEQIGDFYRDRFGSYAGWAHSVLFSADLRQFSEPDKRKLKVTKNVKSKKNKIQL